MTNIIKFYKVHSNPYGCFSNFSPHGFYWPIKSSELWFASSEHYFQAEKFRLTNSGRYNEIINASTPKKAALLGRDKSVKIRSDWDLPAETWDLPYNYKEGLLLVKDCVMLDAIRLKFNQNPLIKDVLMSTNSAELVEDSPIDYYWGCGRDGSGKNMLGKLLMLLRSEFVLNSI